MQTTKQKIDLEALPEDAQKQLIGFYDSLVHKYGMRKKRNLPEGFYHPIKVASYLKLAKREEIYGR